MSPVCKMADNGRLTVDQKVKVVLFYAETMSVVTTQRRFRAHSGTRWASCKQTIYRLSLWTVFQPMSISSVPDVKWFCNNKNVLCVQWMVRHFVHHSVLTYLLSPSSRVLLEKLTGSQLVKKFPTFYETRRFVTAFISAHHTVLRLMN